MSIKHLLTGKSAQFFQRNPRRRLSNHAAAELVKKVSSARSGRLQERRIREKHTVDGAVVPIGLSPKGGALRISPSYRGWGNDRRFPTKRRRRNPSIITVHIALEV